MSHGKEAELLLAFFRYVLRCLAERDFESLRHLNLRSDQLAELSRLRLADLEHVAQVHHRCLHIELDDTALARTIQRLSTARERDQLKQTLIDADANLPMLRQLFGMSSREYTGRRYLSAVGAQRGRPRVPAETEERRVWDAWAVRLTKRASPTLTARDYLAMHRETGEVPLRTIWALTQRWSRDEQCLRLVRQTRRHGAGA